MAIREKYYLRKFAWSPFFYVCWSEERKPIRLSTGETDRKKAEKWKAEFVLELDREKRTGEDLTVEDAIEFYMEKHSIYTPSHKTNEFNKVPIIAFFGKDAAMKVKQSRVREFIKQQEDNDYAPGTIKRQLSLMSAAINFCHAENRIDYAPVILMPEEPDAKDRWLTKEEANHLLASCTERHIRLFIAIALFTGQRKGAILDLKWSQVNFNTLQIDFNSPGRIQTKKKRVPVNMNGEFLPMMLHANKERQEAMKKGKSWSKSEYVVCYRGRGNNGRLGDIKKGFNDSCDAAALKDVTPHTLRHTCGTWMAQAGVPMLEISAVLGHSHSRTTELYIKHHPDYLKNATNAISLAS